MPGIGMIKSVIKEYGVGWVVNRFLYSAKLKMMLISPATEKYFEKKTAYPKRLDLFDFDLGELKDFIQRLSDGDKELLVETADKACEGIIRGFSSLDLDYGFPIDWQMSPLTGKRCDEKKKWFRIPDFDKQRGDIKVIWEASRFSHLLTLARAYLLTDNVKYYAAFSQQLDSWLKNNPYGYGANFKCGQECSLRMINGILSFTVFRKAGLATDADQSKVKDLVDRCYRKILSNFFYAYKCIKNNHTISELMGMIVGAWCCEDETRLNKAFELLDEVINEQFTDDGGYRQFSFTYQRLALQDLECILSIEHRVGRRLSDKSKDKIRKSALLMYQCQDKCGDMPNYGNNDGAVVFPVTSCRYRDFRPVINTIYALTEGKQLYKNGSHQEELIWFSGGKKLADYPEFCVEQVSSAFSAAGLFTLRNRDSWSMVVLNDYKSRPAHLDQLHFDLWVDGVNVLCDAGTYSYASELGRKLVMNESHNSAVADGLTQMTAHGPFMIYNWTERKLISVDNNSFEGTMLSKNGYSHTRKIVTTNSGYEITDSADADYSILFHTPCQVKFENGTARLLHDNKQVCVIITDGTMCIEKSKRSLYYLREEDITCLMIKGKANHVIKTIIKITEKG